MRGEYRTTMEKALICITRQERVYDDWPLSRTLERGKEKDGHSKELL